MPYPFFSERKEKAFFFKETRTYIKQREINLRAGEGVAHPKRIKEGFQSVNDHGKGIIT